MNIYLDSRKICKGDIYISINGKNNGDKYIKDALRRGASFILSENKGKYYVPNLKNNLNKIIIEKYNLKKYPKLIGISGTNGKTTLSYNLNRKLNEIGVKSACITTIKNVKNSYYSLLTTPRNDDLIRILVDSYKKGIEYLIMEVSSIGYKEGRVNDMIFDLGILLEIDSDHLDYHKTLYSYHESKIDFILSCNNFVYGRKNIYSKIEESLHVKFKDYETINPPGRDEIVHSSPLVVIDYAHTKSSYEYILSKYRKKYDSRLICLFGFGGNRDKSKRREIIDVIKRYCDLMIYTNDNPRFENPKKIIYPYIKKGEKIKIILDRKKAINYALSILKDNDVLLIIGKGHEDYQIIKDKRIFFNDKMVVNEYFMNDKS